MQFSDSKYIAQSTARAATPVARPLAPTGDELVALRGIGDRNARHTASIFASTEGEYEPVSFMHPEVPGRRVYGWLVAVEHDGNARVEIGDGEYALVPPDQLRRIGNHAERTLVQDELRRVIGAFSRDADGIRADFRPTGELIPTGPEEQGDYITALTYAASIGRPTPQEVDNYVAHVYPGARIMEADDLMPGRIGLALHFESTVDTTAEMDAQVGGNVIETLDPSGADDAPDGARIADRTAQMNSQRSSSEIAELLAHGARSHSEARQMAARAIEHYITNGGAEAIVRSGSRFGPMEILQAALPMVARGDPGLWRDISKYALRSGQIDTRTPSAPSTNQSAPSVQSNQPGQPTQGPAPLSSPTPLSQQQTQIGQQPTAPFTPVTDPTRTMLHPNIQQGVQDFNEQFPQLRPSTKPAGEQLQNPIDTDQQRQIEELAKGLNNPVASMKSKRASAFDKVANPMAKYNMGPSAGELSRSMHFTRLVKRGDYIVGTVEWNPELFATSARSSVPHAITSFVKGQAALAPGRAQDFGFIGRVHITAIDERKGEAEVQFQSLTGGAAPIETVPGVAEPKRYLT